MPELISNIDLKSEFYSLLLKGNSGFGKTIAACSMAVEGPIYLAYWDKKKPVEVLDFFSTYHPKLLSNLEYDCYGSHNALDYLNLINKWKKEGGSKYIGMITDSLTFMTNSVVGWSLAQDKNARDSGIFVPEMDEYKIETGFVVMALDVTKNLPMHNIWTAHPIPRIKVTAKSDGGVDRISQVNTLVSYGTKVGAIAPGAFNEVYHFASENDYSGKTTVTKRLVLTENIGEDFAKSAIGIKGPIDISNGKLFWEEWKKAVKARTDFHEFKAK